MANFTHEDTGFNSSANSTSLGVSLSNAVSSGDLLVLYVNTDGAGNGNVSVSDSSGNSWNDAYNGEIWYCSSAAAASGGVTITATVSASGHYIEQMIADRFTPEGTVAVVYGGYANTGSSSTDGLKYNTTGCGDLGIVPAGALAWGAFSADSATGDQAYTPGYQAGTTAPANVIGCQFAGANGTGLSVCVTDCVNEDTTLSWYGTGTGTFGHGVSMFFTVTPATTGPGSRSFTHQDTGIARSGGTSALSVTLSKPVSAGDLLVTMVESASAPTLSDTAGNTWTLIGPFDNFFYAAYVLSSGAAASGITIQAATGAGVHQVAVDRFTPSGIATFGGSASSAPGSSGLNIAGTNNLGNLGTVPAGALAWGGFAVDDANGNQAYTAGFQSGSSGTADAMGSQITGANGSGFTAFAANCSHADAALTWHGTGHEAQGTAVSLYFIATTVFQHADSVIAQATSNVTVLSATLTQPVQAGDLLVACGKSPDGSMTSANWSDSAGNTWTVAGGGNFVYLAYCLASAPAPNGLTVTVTTEHISYHGLVVDRFTLAPGYDAVFGGFSDSLDLSSFTLGLNYPYNNSPAGTITGVPADALAWMGFFTLGTGPVTYSGGYQSGSHGNPAAIGSQVMEADNYGGFSEYVLSTDSSGTVAMTWSGTGSNAGGWAVEGYFIAVPASSAAGHLIASFP